MLKEKKKQQQSLHKRHSELAMANKQLEKLSNGIFASGELPLFSEKIKETEQFPLRPNKLEILQINVGYMCNQVCEHCHVDAGPDRKEIMTRETMMQCLEVIRNTGAHTLDLTGGAPEMNPDFRWFVDEASKAGIKDFIVRSNLTIIRANKKYYNLPEFFKNHNVHVVSSMPHWTRGKTDKQRGEGVFDQSIKALQELNAVGYGMPDNDLRLDLVYNPSGAFLPGDQASMEKDFKKSTIGGFRDTFPQPFCYYEPANFPVFGLFDCFGKLRGLYVFLSGCIQPRSCCKRDVSQYHLGELGRVFIRLRFQPNAGIEGGEQNPTHFRIQRRYPQ